MSVMKTRIAKITTTSIRAKPHRCKISDPPAPVCCAIIFGEASGIVAREKDGQSFLGMTGKFEATNVETMDVFTSGICYLPSGMHEMCTDILLKNADAVVQFGLEMWAVPANNPAGYSWTAKEIADIASSDPLEHLKVRVRPEYRLRYAKLLAIENVSADEYSTALDNDEMEELLLGPVEATPLKVGKK